MLQFFPHCSAHRCIRFIYMLQCLRRLIVVPGDFLSSVSYPSTETLLFLVRTLFSFCVQVLVRFGALKISMSFLLIVVSATMPVFPAFFLYCSPCFLYTKTGTVLVSVFSSSVIRKGNVFNLK
jgi:hypothetical protein